MGYILVFVAIFLCFYIHGILKNRSDKARICYVIDKFGEVMSRQQRSEEDIKRNLLMLMPRIYSDIYFMDHMNYDDSFYELEYKAQRIYSQLLARIDELEYEYPKMLLPFNALLKAFLFPSQVFAWFGVNLNMVVGRIVSLIVWVIISLINSNSVNLIERVFNWLKSFLS